MRSLLTVAAVAAALAICTSAWALPAHTWVAGYGSDSTGTGTSASPWASFAHAVTNTAAGGVISVVGSGDFGTVDITKAITIDGCGASAGVVIAQTGQVAITVSAGPTDRVVIRNLTINGGGATAYGVAYVTGGSLLIDRCEVDGFPDHCVADMVNQGSPAKLTIRDTNLVGAADGLDIFAQGSVVVDNSTIEDPNDYGILIGAPINLTIKNSTLDGGQNGLYTEVGAGRIFASLKDVTVTNTTSAGIYDGSGVVDLTDCIVSQNSGYGVYAISGYSAVDIERGVFTGNGTAIASHSGSVVRLNNADIYNNTTGLSVTGTGAEALSAGNNHEASNRNNSAPTGTLQSF